MALFATILLGHFFGTFIGFPLLLDPNLAEGLLYELVTLRKMNKDRRFLHIVYPDEFLCGQRPPVRQGGCWHTLFHHGQHVRDAGLGEVVWRKGAGKVPDPEVRDDLVHRGRRWDRCSVLRGRAGDGGG